MGSQKKQNMYGRCLKPSLKNPNIMRGLVLETKEQMKLGKYAIFAFTGDYKKIS